VAVTDFDTKVGVVVRDDLAAWQRLNVTAFLMSGVTAFAGAEAIGEPYRDADDRSYLPLLVQPVLVFEASGSKLRTVRERAERRGVPVAIYTAEMFTTGNDSDNRAAVRGGHRCARPGGPGATRAAPRRRRRAEGPEAAPLGATRTPPPGAGPA
jgi:hypothetical protein